MSFLDTKTSFWTDKEYMHENDLQDLRDAFKANSYDNFSSTLISILTAPLAAVGIILASGLGYAIERSYSNADEIQELLDFMQRTDMDYSPVKIRVKEIITTDIHGNVTKQELNDIDIPYWAI